MGQVDLDYSISLASKVADMDGVGIKSERPSHSPEIVYISDVTSTLPELLDSAAYSAQSGVGCSLVC